MRTVNAGQRVKSCSVKKTQKSYFSQFLIFPHISVLHQKYITVDEMFTCVLSIASLRLAGSTVESSALVRLGVWSPDNDDPVADS